MIRVRAAKNSDKDGILRLFSDTFGERSASRAESQWNWRWSLHPQVGTQGYIGTVAEWRSQIIGSATYLPACLFVHGQPVTASWAVDVVVDSGKYRQALRQQSKNGSRSRPEALRKGLAAALLEHRTVNRMLLSKHISGPMETIASRIGFRTLPDSGMRTLTVSVAADYKRYLGPSLASVAAWIPDRVLIRLPETDLKTANFDGEFDHHFDSLWGRVFKAYSAIGLRDAQYLNWRYRRHPFNRYNVITLPDNDCLRGYIVVSMSIKSGLKQGNIIDLLTAVDDHVAVEALVLAAIKYLRGRGAVKIHCYAAPHGLIGILIKLGFTSARKTHPALVRDIQVCEPFFMEGDGDGG